MTLSVRRRAAVLTVGAALLLAGCGELTPAGPDRAAVVDGQVITETSLQSGMGEVNAMKPQLLQEHLTPSGTLTALIQAPIVLGYLRGKGVIVSESVARQDAQRRGISDPSSSTLEIIKLASAVSSAQAAGKLADADAAALTQQLQALDIDVNPRYGTFDPKTASVSLTSPEWVTALNAPQ